MHPRKRTYGYSTRNEHMPEAHRQHSHLTPERLLEMGGAHRAVKLIVKASYTEPRPHPEQSYRFCLGP